MLDQKDFTFFVASSRMLLYWNVSWHAIAIILILVAPLLWWVKGLFLMFTPFSLIYYYFKCIKNSHACVLRCHQNCLSLAFNGTTHQAITNADMIEQPIILVGEQRIFSGLIELRFRFVGAIPERKYFSWRKKKGGWIQHLVISKDAMPAKAFHELKVFIKTHAAQHAIPKDI